MKNFEYAQPQTLSDLLGLLTTSPGSTALLGGGTDLVGLMKRMVVTPDRVVNICDVEEMQGIERHDESGALVIGAAVCLDQLLASPLLDPFEAVKQAIRGTASLQFRCQSTLGGELCRRPRCWYFRQGHGLLAQQGKMVVEGDNRYHALLGNSGPAKFVNASRLAPPLIALGALVRIAGPGVEARQDIPLEALYQTPRREGQRENVLQHNQVVTHLILPLNGEVANASYEVKHGVGPDDPLVTAAAALRLAGSVVQSAKVVLGYVAPIPWVSQEAAEQLIGQRLSEELAEQAGRAAVAMASPLSHNAYKVQLAKVAVKRAILQAAGVRKGELYV